MCVCVCVGGGGGGSHTVKRFALPSCVVDGRHKKSLLLFMIMGGGGGYETQTL